MAWEPEKGERLKVVGLPGYNEELGTMVGRTGAGLFRVQMDRDGAVVGADGWNIRQLSELEQLAAEAPKKLSHLGLALRDIRALAQSSTGEVAKAYYRAAELVASAMKAQGLK